MSQSTTSPYEIQTKPHGHGDVHYLLHSSGQAAKLKEVRASTVAVLP